MKRERVYNQSMDPRELMHLAKSGDAEAFSALYERYFVPVYRYIYARVRSRADAEDMTQTVFIKTFESVAGFEDRGKDPLAYFFTAARNTVINHWRKKKEVTVGVPEALERVEVRTAKISEDAIDARLASDTVFSAMDNLSAAEQEVITMRYVSGLSTKEIAALVGKKEDAIRQLQSRGLRRLRSHLQEESLLQEYA
jgi:RNA polymerase sigma-70 factor (ECF subfamily)